MILTDFGNNLRKLRKELTGLSQEAFAVSINMDRTYYSSVENGERNISLINIKKIADGLGISIYKLFEKIEEDEK